MSRSMSVFCITHAFISGHLTHLAPFAVWTAFPPSDYYGASVPMRLSPFSESRVSCAVDVQAGLGAHFVSLGSLSTTRASRSVLRPGSTCPVVSSAATHPADFWEARGC